MRLIRVRKDSTGQAGRLRWVLDHPCLPERFWAKVSPEPNSGCWLWSASSSPNGYGQYHYQKRLWAVHRLVYSLLVKPVPVGVDLHHRCETKICCNPEHLEPTTRSEHLREHIKLGGWNIGTLEAGKTHCLRGHEYTPDNTYTRRRGDGRVCRECKTCWRVRREERRPQCASYE